MIADVLAATAELPPNQAANYIAPRSYLLEKAVEQAKTAACSMDESELTDLIDEAVQWAREH